MKLSIALLILVEILFLKVESLQKIHQQKWKPPCADNDAQCWNKLGQQCTMEDNLCMAKVLQVPESSLPDCESADQKCWSVFWFKLNSNDESFFDHRKIGRGNGHKKKNIYNHKTLGRGDGQKKQ